MMVALCVDSNVNKNRLLFPNDDSYTRESSTEPF